MRGLPIPPHLEPPYLDEFQLQYAAAFWELSTCRQIHMQGGGPIPWSALDHYAERQGLLNHEILYDDFKFIIRQMDEEFIEDQARRREQEKANNGKSKGVRSKDGGSGGGRFV